jgi:hypothetical protein
VSPHGAVWYFPSAQIEHARFTASCVAVHALAWYCHAPARLHSTHTASCVALHAPLR